MKTTNICTSLVRSLFKNNLDTYFIHHLIVSEAAAAASSQSGGDEEAGRDTEARKGSWYTGGGSRVGGGLPQLSCSAR